MPDPLEARSGLAGNGPNHPELARIHSYEMENNPAENAERPDSPASPRDEYEIAPIGAKGMAKYTVGLLLLLVVVVLWTGSNFLGSSIFADNTYAKPFFLTYLNTSFFMLAMVPSMARSSWNLHKRNEWRAQLAWIRGRYHRGGWRFVLAEDEDGEKDDSEGEGLMTSSDQDNDEDLRISNSTIPGPKRRPLSQRKHVALLPTAWLSFKFGILWFTANYFAMACLQHTTVASATILSSTSSIWTLLLGTLTRTEKFTLRKLLGVVASLFGIFLISHTDFSPTPASSQTYNSSNPSTSQPTPRASNLIPRSGSFPTKSPSEIILGDAFALLSAILYAIYTITLKHVSDTHLPLKLNMPLFFGLVGMFNFLLLWPGFVLLNLTSIEPFQLPPTQRIWTILLINSVAALASDIAWAWAMLLTSPLVVTVGLSLTIPLSLIGEMIIQARFETPVYWVGSVFVVFSFAFIAQEENREGPEMEAEVVMMQRHRERYGDDDRTKWDRFKEFITYRGS